MRKLKAIVVDDERMPRLSLLQKLEAFRQEVEVVDSCDNYDSALKSILQLKPDLLFLDIQLQGHDAIQLLEELKQTQPLPYVIFTTAYSERRYLMSAVKLSAVDYLLKPIDENELAIAIAKVGAREAEGAGVRGYGSAGKRGYEEGEANGRLTFKTVNGKLFLTPQDIAYVQADGNYSTLVTFDTTENVMESLASMEQHLDSRIFARIDRSTIVNIQQVYKLNIKRRQCTLRSNDNATITLELSKTGIDTIQKLI